VSSYSKGSSAWPMAYPSPSTTGALIMYLAYGFDIKSHEDPFLSAAERALVIMEEAVVPGTFLVNAFPICTWSEEKCDFSR
jgi:hypothetical protein